MLIVYQMSHYICLWQHVLIIYNHFCKIRNIRLHYDSGGSQKRDSLLLYIYRQERSIRDVKRAQILLTLVLRMVSVRRSNITCPVMMYQCWTSVLRRMSSYGVTPCYCAYELTEHVTHCHSNLRPQKYCHKPQTKH
mgnify:CR=1 FL=1